MRTRIQYPNNGDTICFFPQHKHHKCRHNQQDLFTTLVTSGHLTKAQIVQQFHLTFATFHSFVAKARRNLRKISKKVCIHYDRASSSYCVGLHTKVGFGRLQRADEIVTVQFKNDDGKNGKLHFIPLNSLTDRKYGSRYYTAKQQEELAKTEANKALSEDLAWKRPEQDDYLITRLKNASNNAKA